MLGIIGGTGLGEALFGEHRGEEVQIDTPFGKPSGAIRLVEWHGRRIALLARHGEGHVFNPTQVPYRANVFALKKIGVTQILASGAVGSLRNQIRPRDLAVVDQVIDKTFRRSSTFFERGLAVHADFAQPFCPRLRSLALAAAENAAMVVHEHATYVCMEGPAFSTIAESHLHRAWGADLIGMTALPEAKLAREAEICYCLIALVTDYDCWQPHNPGTPRHAVLNEIIAHLKAATANAVALMRSAAELLGEPGEPGPACECGRTLDLAIWTARDKITPEMREYYSPLLERALRT